MNFANNQSIRIKRLGNLAQIATFLVASLSLTLFAEPIQPIPTPNLPPKQKVIHKTKKQLKQTKEKIQTIASTATQRNTPSQTTLNIQGLREMTQGEALLLLGNMIDQIVTNAPTPSRADDAAFLLETSLRKNGYPEAAVDWNIPKGKSTINLVVHQGPTRNMGEVFVKGITPEHKSEIESYFKDSGSSILPTGDQTVPYLPDRVQDSIVNAQSYLEAEGHWKAQVQLEKINIHKDTGMVDHYLNVVLGPLYHLSPIQLRGQSPIDTTPLRKKLAKFTGLPASAANILKAQADTISYFTEQGYTFATVVIGRDLIGNHAHITLNLDVGQKYKIGKVIVTGLERTDPAVLKRRFDRIVGRDYDPAKMALNRKKLISTGAFKSVLMDTQPNADGTIDLMLKMQEGKARGISNYLGAGSFEGFIVGLGYHDRNFLGKLQSLAISAEFSGLGLLGRASITNPMFRGSDRSLSFNTFLLSHEFDGYLKYELGVGTELVWTVSDHYSVRFYGEGLVAAVRSNGLPDDVLGYQDYTVLRAGVTQQLDYRNDPLNPNKGFHGELTLETGVATGDSGIPYSRIIVQTSYRQPINTIQYVTVTGSMGGILNNDAENFPVDLRFFTGGPNSVRSFPRREMGPTANGNYRGGEAYWVTSVEYNRKVAGPLWTNLFVDAGSLSVLASDLGSSDVDLAVGLGFWLNLPIGPIRAEYGYNLTRDSGEPAGTFHFTIGVSF